MVGAEAPGREHNCICREEYVLRAAATRARRRNNPHARDGKRAARRVRRGRVVILNEFDSAMPREQRNGACGQRRDRVAHCADQLAAHGPRLGAAARVRARRRVATRAHDRLKRRRAVQL